MATTKANAAEAKEPSDATPRAGGDPVVGIDLVRVSIVCEPGGVYRVAYLLRETRESGRVEMTDKNVPEQVIAGVLAAFVQNGWKKKFLKALVAGGHEDMTVKE